MTVRPLGGRLPGQWGPAFPEEGALVTVREILGVVARRWYTSAFAFALVAVLVFLMLQDGGTYTTRTVIDFRWPGAARLDPLNGFADESVIGFAGLVAQKVNAGHDPDRYATDEAPLYGAGRREAEFVEVSFVGSQFASAYPNAAIEVHVIGRARESVEERRKALVDNVLQTSIRLQEAAGTSQLITQEVRPLSSQIDYVAPSRLSKISAFSAMTAAGAIAGVGLALLWEKTGLRLRRSSRHRGRAEAT